jgi:hypothetical protein
MLAVGCGERFGVCHSGDCVAHPDASGGAGGDAAETSSAAGKSEDPVPMGGTTVNGGTTDPGSDGGAAEMGGAGGAPEPVAVTPACAAGYHAWLSSSFSFPDGDVIGTADFPSMPWRKTGSLKIDAGRLVGTGTALVSQGAAFPYSGARLRFRVRFTDARQQVTAAFGASKSGDGGARVTVDAAGRIALLQGTAELAHAEAAPLETGVDWFVEATFYAEGAAITVARSNYGTDKLADVKASLDVDKALANATGTKALLVLTSGSGIAPAVDELIVSRCGVSPPTPPPSS